MFCLIKKVVFVYSLLLFIFETKSDICNNRNNMKKYVVTFLFKDKHAWKNIFKTNT